MQEKRKNKPGAGRPVTDWTAAKVKLLKKLYPTTDNEKVSVKLGMSVSAVRNAAVRFGIKKNGRYWSDKDIAYLQEHWDGTSAEKIAEKLGKTRWSVINKYRELTKINK